MRKMIICGAVLLIQSCSFVSSLDDDITNCALAESMANGTIISIEEARNNLEEFLSCSFTKSSSGCKREIENSYTLGGLSSTKNGENSGPVVHIFNFKDSLGFAIMSGDRRVGSILCVTEKGTLNMDSEIDNPGFAIALAELEDYYEMRLEMAAEIDTSSVGYEHTYDYGPWENYSTIGTILNSNWDQRDPFNANCLTADYLPSYPGCTAVAVGQIMYYWGKNVTYKNRYWDWTKMRRIVNRYSNPSDSSCWTLVQQFLALLGNPDDLDASYGTGSTAVTDLNNVVRTFEHFGYCSGGSYQNYDFSTLKSALADGPALGHGADSMYVTHALGIVINTTYKSHDWVFDQVLTRRRRGYMYEGGVCVNSFYDYEDLVHINWGWDGYCDGYYANTRFNANEGAITRSIGTTAYGSYHYYRYNLQMNCGINPE